jgi:hypothetical protein
MAISANQQELAPDYRYFLCDLVTDEVLVEAPFSNVTYGRSIREAGAFSGDIPITPDTYNLNLYANTLPGRTALYIVRNGVCIWGGIIWSRAYDIVNKILNVNANEFTSYLYHRVAWKTWSNEYEATVTVTAGTGSAVLDTESFNFTPGYPVYITFGDEINDRYDGFYYVVGDPAPTTTTFSFREKDGAFLSMPDSTSKPNKATVTVRQDTYEFARDFLEALKTDFFNLRYDNTEIEPSAEFAQTISSISRASNQATVVFPQSHQLIVGQRITVKNTLQTGFDGRQIVTSVPSSTTIVYANAGPDQSATELSETTKTVTLFSRKNFVNTLTTSDDHGFLVGDIVEVVDVNGSVDGIHTILSVPSTTTFTYTSTFASTLSESTTSTGSVVRSPEVRFSTYGEFSQNSGLDIEYSTQEFSIQEPRTNSPFRGSDLSYVGELLEEYSNIIGGFEYRIDCEYDEVPNSFSRTFVFLPLEPTSLTEYKDTLPYNKLPAGKYAPISAYGADAIVFEHPGNILNATMQESAEDAATRFWVQGDDDTDTEGAALPHAADSAVDLLGAGWPILDQVEKMDGITSTDEDVLFNYATKFLAEAKPPLSTFSISVDGSLRPVLGSYKPGDWCSIIIEDEFVQLRMQSSLEAGGDDEGRSGILLRKIDSYEVTVPNGPSSPEEVTINLVNEANVDVPGDAVLEVSLLSKTSSSVTLALFADLGLDTNIEIELIRGSTSVETWDLSAYGVLDETYTVTGLSSDTEYVFFLNGPGGYQSSITVRTE